MNTKLTVRLDDGLIRRAKRHAHRSGKSVSKMIADYFALLETDESLEDTRMSSGVRALVGCLEGASLDEEDYRTHLEERHQ